LDKKGYSRIYSFALTPQTRHVFESGKTEIFRKMKRVLQITEKIQKSVQYSMFFFK